MSRTYSNVSEVPLSLAVFLATDNYDHNDDPNTISATALIKPLRQIILSARVPDAENIADLTQMVASRMGSAVHDGIERAWKTNHSQAMQSLGFPQKIIDRIQINPSKEELSIEGIPVYLEQRLHKTIGKYTISGKFDFIGEGRVEDFKTTSTFTAMNHTNDDKYIWQGSIYRWLDPEKITSDEMAIQFLFTDWNAGKAKADPNYPQRRFKSQVFGLKSIAETEAYITRKLAMIEQYWDSPEEEIPQCSDEDLWRSEPVFKYYKNPSKTVRSTKNYPLYQEAMMRYIEDGSVGLVKEQPGQVTACKYCPAFPVCTQKDVLVAQGDLVL